MHSSSFLLKIQQKALNILNRRMLTEQELIKKLYLYFPDKNEEINQVILNLKNINLINDEKFVQVYLNYEIKNHFRGKQAYWSKLELKGISKNLFEEIWQSFAPDEFNMAQKLIEQNEFRFKNEINEIKKKQKMQRFLLGRGFSFSIIAKSI